MSHASPKPDIEFFNDYLTTFGMKKLASQSFSKRRLEKIAEKIGEEDWLQGQLAKVDIESYFNNNDHAKRILENALKVTKHRRDEIYSFYLKVYIREGNLADIQGITDKLAKSKGSDSEIELEVIRHISKVYNSVELLEFYDYPEKNDDIVEIESIVNKLAQFNVTLSSFRFFISLIYSEFYKKISGVIQPKLTFEENEIVIRVDCTVNDSQNLFELNNSYRDKIMTKYSNLSEQQCSEFDKVIVYFKYKNFESTTADMV